MGNEEINHVNIRPGVGILSVLSHLNYRPWFALAEFIDNSIQSYLSDKEEITSIDKSFRHLRISVKFEMGDSPRIIIRDNAGGIHTKDIGRAFRPAEIPPDRTGLSEFGMGMKSAACWFAKTWEVRTSAIGEMTERTLSFDIDNIVKDDIEELEVQSRPVPEEHHYTEITLSNLNHRLHGRTIGKIKEYLASIFRRFLSTNEIRILIDGTAILFVEPPILSAPFFKDLARPPTTWRAKIDFDFGEGLSVTGFAALRARASTSEAGFALFRRNRLIQGAGEESYRPSQIFGRSNSYTYQRLFGELNIEGMDVSHTKDGFQWDENEEPFLSLLKERLNDDSMPLLAQAEGHRAKRHRTTDLIKGAETATSSTAIVVRDQVPPVLEDILKHRTSTIESPTEEPNQETIGSREITISFNDQLWDIQIAFVNSPEVGDWISFREWPNSHRDRKSDARKVSIQLSTAHPFMLRFCGNEARELEPLLRIGVAISLSEIAARESGAATAGSFRRNINKLLRDALSKP